MNWSLNGCFSILNFKVSTTLRWWKNWSAISAIHFVDFRYLLLIILQIFWQCSIIKIYFYIYCIELLLIHFHEKLVNIMHFIIRICSIAPIFKLTAHLKADRSLIKISAISSKSKEIWPISARFGDLFLICGMFRPGITSGGLLKSKT